MNQDLLLTLILNQYVQFLIVPVVTIENQYLTVWERGEYHLPDEYAHGFEVRALHHCWHGDPAREKLSYA